ncbi:MAG: reactive intermediate/imine deaminase [Anaerolineae bacterium]|nr:reactive intermediate/imine deaminase [Anaerolineae bacterium]
MSRQVIQSDSAPKPIGPYSQAIASNGFVYTAGQLGLDPATGQLVEGGVAAQTEQALRNLSAVLTAAGTSIENVIKTTVYLHAISDFPHMNKVYGEFFKTNPPARTTVGDLDLPMGAQVEIEVVAVIP